MKIPNKYYKMICKQTKIIQDEIAFQRFSINKEKRRLELIRKVNEDNLLDHEEYMILKDIEFHQTIIASEKTRLKYIEKAII